MLMVLTGRTDLVEQLPTETGPGWVRVTMEGPFVQIVTTPSHKWAKVRNPRVCPPQGTITEAL